MKTNFLSQHRRNKDAWVFVLILSVSAVIAYEYFSGVDQPNFELRLELHDQIIRGTAPSPYRYRVLVPFMMEALTTALSHFISKKAGFFLSYAIYDLLAVFFLLGLLFVWLKNWFSKEHALIGVLFVAGTMPIALQDHFFQPWSLLEAGLFSAALLAIYQKRYFLLVFLVVLASLNRETGILIPLVFLLTSLDGKSYMKERRNIEWKPIVVFCIIFTIWAVIFLGLRYHRGYAPGAGTLMELFIRNTSGGNLLFVILNVSLFLGGFWLFTFLGYKYAPGFIQRTALIVPFYLLLVIIWGAWREVRLFMPLYPVLVPLGLSFLFQQDLKDGNA